LRGELASYHSVNSALVVCGNGASDLIYRIVQCLRPARGLVCDPCFGEYARALQQGGAAVDHYALPGPAFELDEGICGQINTQTGIVFLANPNNPTGLLCPPAVLERIARRCQEVGSVLVLDECFIEMVDDPQQHTMLPQLANYSKLVILRAFTKAWAMAGLRLGYMLCSDAGLAAAIANTGQPWCVSAPAQAAGIQALRSSGYLQRLRQLLAQERARLRRGLEAVGITVLGGQANYLFWRTPAGSGDLYELLWQRGILVRSCANFAGLDGSYYRSAVHLPAQNDQLLEALEQVMQP
jgi:threonine-phosphate decarboxylase